MKITKVNLFEVCGEMAFLGTFWEERLVRPVDIYPEHKAEGAHWLSEASEGRYELRSVFCEIRSMSM